MGLFGRDDRSSQAQPDSASPAAAAKAPAAMPSGAGATLTVIASGCRNDGAVGGSGDIQVQGELTGEVTSSGSLVVAESGTVKATVHARTVIVAGSVQGDVSADEKIELKPSANLRGNITAPRIMIQDGATFEGQVFMKNPARKGPGKAADPPPAKTDEPARTGKGGKVAG
jgi:cytoskeletal protein CcmA (bactofilin family)